MYKCTPFMIFEKTQIFEIFIDFSWYSGIFKSKNHDKIDYIIGDAETNIPKLKETFDLVFIDADKENYSKFFDLVFPKLSKGGFIIVDNVLWSGKILNEKKDKLTKIIHNFNKKISKDHRIRKVILPIRDGITLIQKKWRSIFFYFLFHFSSLRI